jgi:glycosyltransferase involved in cell wall biosynthesis
MNKLISIITPSYNSCEFISQTINSVLAQSFSNWEMIIVDDCSVDDSIHVINDFIQKDSRIKLILNDKNEGAAVCRNKAIESASGKYIAFLDSDDLWEPFKLEKQINFMEENDVPFTYSSYALIDEQGHSLHRIITPNAQLNYFDLLRENQIGCLTAIYDQEVLGKCYMPLIRKRQDYGLWLSILKISPIAYRAPGVLAKYRAVSYAHLRANET